MTPKEAILEILKMIFWGIIEGIKTLFETPLTRTIIIIAIIFVIILVIISSIKKAKKRKIRIR